MLSLYLRFMFQFSLIIYNLFGLVISGREILENSFISIRNQCKSDWYYLSEERICIIFATSQVGDVSWYNGYKACETNSAELLILSNSKSIQSIQKQIHQNEKYIDHIRRGAWIGKTEYLKDDLCDKTTEDFQLNCIILTIRLNDQSLCLKKVSCKENHPFICQNSAMTERELVESTMERMSWWKCIINVIWCVVDDAQQANAEKAAAAAKAAEIQAYINQFDFNVPDQMITSSDQPAALMGLQKNLLTSSDSGSPSALFLITGGLFFVLMIFICSVIFICICKKIKKRSSEEDPARNDDSDSIYST